MDDFDAKADAVYAQAHGACICARCGEAYLGNRDRPYRFCPYCGVKTAGVLATLPYDPPFAFGGLTKADDAPE